MTLLRLSPDSERLRRIAKAHAAGELSTPDYRRIRAEVIERFGSHAAEDRGDNTERRSFVRPTPAQVERTDADDEAVPAVPRIRWWPWLALCVLFAIAFATAGAWASTIPPVNARDPNPATSERIGVDALVVRNFTAFPDLGITADAVDALLAQALAELDAASRPGPSGFTQAELEQIGLLLKSLGVREGRALSERDAAQLSALIATQKTRRGASLVELERIAARLTTFYRAHGLPLATAYLPAQDVVDAQVGFDVLPGTLEDVHVDGQSRIDPALLSSAFADQRNEPVRRDRVESAMYLINDLPGMDAQATFAAGQAVGGSDLNLVARNERAWDASLRVDNEGDDHTGEERLLVDLSWLDPTGRGDVLSVGGIATRDPQNSYYGYLAYAAPLTGLRTRLSASLSRDAFDYTDGLTRTDGTADTARIGATHVLSRGRTRSVSFDAALNLQKLQLDGRGPSSSLGSLTDQTLWFASAGVATERVFDLQHLSSNARLGVDGGGIDSNRAPGQSSPFYRLRADGSAWRLVHVPGFAAPQTIRLVVAGQLASTAMPGTLQMGLGGPGRVSAYDRSTASVDDGLFADLDLRLSPAAGRAGDFLLFANGGYGQIKREFDSDVSVGLASVGIGWDMPLGRWFGEENRLDAQLRFSVPVADKGSQDWVDDDGVTLYWILRYVP